MASYKEVPRDQKVSGDAPDGAAGTASNSAPSERDRNYDRKETTAPATHDSDDEPSPTHSLRMVDHYVTGRSLPTPPVMLRGREVLLAIGVFFLFSVSVGLFVVMVKDYMDPKTDCSKGDKATCKPDTCLTEPCVEKAAFMLQLMNKSAKPCDDFWNYACGGWLARTSIPESFKSWGVGQDVEKRIKAIVRQLIERPIARDTPASSERKAKTLYRACMNVKAIDRAGKTSLETIINDLGGWAVVDSWRKEHWDFQKVLGHMHFTYWTDVFFTVWVAPDDKVSSKNVLQFDQSGLGMPDKSYYSRPEKDPVVKAYKAFMGAIAKLLGATNRVVGDFVRKTFAFEQSLAQLHMDAGSDLRSSPKAMYNNVTIDELQTIAGSVNWLEFLHRLTPDVTPSTVVLITNRSYMGNISKLIEDTDHRVLNYYMIWRLVQNQASHLSEPFRRAEQAYEAAEKGTRSSIARWQYCLKAVNEWFGMTVGAMFVREHFPRDSRADVEQMIKNIRETFLDTLKDNPWMDSATKANATKKLQAMGYKIGYPPFITNMTKVDVFYRWFSVEANDKYFDINLKCIGGSLRKMANELRRSEGNDEWEMNPHEVNAYYTPVTNQMVFPAGILQKPYYTKNVPIYVNYGGIGATIGHELTHGFDNFGSQYDKDGNLNNWWSKTSWTNFRVRTSCMVKYYSGYTVNNISVNGQLTLGENIADVGGVIQAYEAYKKAEKTTGQQLRMPALNLTNDQVFFLSFGQSWCSKRRPENMKQYLVRNVHSPAAVRARGTLSLVPQFAQAFKCGAAAPMNPAEKCKVW